MSTGLLSESVEQAVVHDYLGYVHCYMPIDLGFKRHEELPMKINQSIYKLNLQL